MPSPSPAPRPVTPAPAPEAPAPDAASTTRPEAPRRAPSPDTASSLKRPRPSSPVAAVDALDDDAWHSRAWRVFAHGKRAARPGPAAYAWGYPVDN